MAKQTQSEFRYLPVEVCLIPLIDDQMDALFNYAIVRMAKNNDLNETEVLNKVVWLYNNHKLPEYISEILNEFLDDNEFYRSHDCTGGFDAQYERDLIKDYFINSEHGDLKWFIRECMQYAQINKTLWFMGIKVNSYDFLIKDYRKIKCVVDNHESKYGNDALVMIKKDHWFEFTKTDKDYREFEVFKAFLAIKSIQGASAYVTTNKSHIQARMIGAKNKFIAEKLVSRDKRLKEQYAKYAGRYFFDQLLLSVRSQYHVSEIGILRKMFFSTSLTQDQLAHEVVNHAKNIQLNNAEKQIKKIDKETKNWIYKQLKNS